MRLQFERCDVALFLRSFDKNLDAQNLFLNIKTFKFGVAVSKAHLSSPVLSSQVVPFFQVLRTVDQSNKFF